MKAMADKQPLSEIAELLCRVKHLATYLKQ